MRYLFAIFLLLVPVLTFCREAPYRYSRILSVETGRETPYRYNNNSGILSVEIGGRYSRLYVVELYKDSCALSTCRGGMVRQFYQMESDINLRVNVPVGKYLVRAYYTTPDETDMMRCDRLFPVKVENPGKYFSLVKPYK
jgi:hypothetical protein